MPIKTFENFISQDIIPIINQQRRGQSFEISFEQKTNNIIVPIEILGAYNILPLEIFNFIIRELMFANNNSLRRGNGNARGATLGSEACPFASIEGLIASKFYDKKEGDTVFRRISTVANILVAAGICEHGVGVLILKTEFRNKLK